MNKNFFELYIILFFLCVSSVFSYSEDTCFDSLPDVTSSTAFIQELSNNVNPDIKVITAKDIKLLGVENIPDLLDRFSNINVYRINQSTVNVNFLGIPGCTKIEPTILVDGSEVIPNPILKYYFYNILYNTDFSIEDIDRVEIVRNAASLPMSLNSPAGVINIVTKSPEMLSANYLNTGVGSDGLAKATFSLNKFLLNSYLKLNGEIREADELHSSKKANENKFLNLKLSKYLSEDSLISVKTSYHSAELRFTGNDKGFFGNSPVDFIYNADVKSMNDFNFFINYKYPLLDISFLYNRNFTKLRMNLYNNYQNIRENSEFYKFLITKTLKLGNLKTDIGLEDRFAKGKINIQGRAKENRFKIFLYNDYELTGNLSLQLKVKNDWVKKNGSDFTYFAGMDFHKSDKLSGVKLSYSKNVEYKSFAYKYLSSHLNITDVKAGLPVSVKDIYVYNNKKISPTKFYSTNLSFYKNTSTMEFVTDFFYNRIYGDGVFDTHLDMSNFFNPKIYAYSKALLNYVLHGFETDLKYRVNRNIKLYTSYYLQHIKLKNIQKQSDMIIPKYKLTGGIMFAFPLISGSINCKYLPKVKKANGSSDSFTSLDVNVLKKFKGNNLEISIAVKNILNDAHKEIDYGEEMGRSFFVNLNYKF